MNPVHPSVSHHLVNVEHARHLAHAERMRMLPPRGTAGAERDSGRSLSVRQRFAVAAATLLLTLSAAAATAVAVSDASGAAAGNAADAASDCIVVGLSGHEPC